MEAGDAPVSACPERPQWSWGLPGSSFLVSPQHGREPPGRQGSGMDSDLAQPLCGDIKGCGCFTPPLLLFACSLYGGVSGWATAAGLTCRGQLQWQSFHTISACHLRPSWADRPPEGQSLEGVPQSTFQLVAPGDS